MEVIRNELWTVFGNPVGFITINSLGNLIKFTMYGSKDFVKDYVQIIDEKSSHSFEMKYSRNLVEEQKFNEYKNNINRPFKKYIRIVNKENGSDSGWKLIN